MSKVNCIVVRLMLTGLLGAVASSTAHAQITITPNTLSYGNVNVGLVSAIKSLTVNNTGTKTVTVTSLTISAPEFLLKDGLVNQSIQAGKMVQYNFVFLPDLPQSFTATATYTIDGTQYSAQLSGTGVATGAVSSLSTTSLRFGSVAQGTTSTQNVTVTNTGTDSLTIETITACQPFLIGGFTAPVTLSAGQSFTFQVSFIPSLPNSYTGTVNLTYDVLPANGISLSGRGAAPAGLAIASFPTLPSSVQGYAYNAQLRDSGGKSPYYFQITSGSLPTGLTMSTGGLITGTVASSVAAGNYTVTVQSKDSSSPRLNATASITIPVAAPPGSACNNIVSDGTGTTPLIPLIDLGTGTYFGYTGGLYGNGSNQDPSAHLNGGIGIAKAITPLDINGNPDPTNGKIVLLSVGVSATEEDWDVFQGLANADPSKNPQVLIVQGAQGGENAVYLSNVNNAYWSQIADYLIPEVGSSPEQVQIVYMDSVDSAPAAPPTDITTLQPELESIAQNLLTIFPNVKIAYFDQINYGGYSNGVSTTDPEPGPYDGGFAIQGMMLDQINGVSLNWNPNVGPVVAPWLHWGPYFWANGLTPRRDGYTWACTDVTADGVHPSSTSGRPKIANQLLNFFKTDPTATPWFLTKQTQSPQ